MWQRRQFGAHISAWARTSAGDTEGRTPTTRMHPWWVHVRVHVCVCVCVCVCVLRCARVCAYLLFHELQHLISSGCRRQVNVVVDLHHIRKVGCSVPCVDGLSVVVQMLMTSLPRRMHVSRHGRDADTLLFQEDTTDHVCTAHPAPYPWSRAHFLVAKGVISPGGSCNSSRSSLISDARRCSLPARVGVWGAGCGGVGGNISERNFQVWLF